MGAHTFEYGYPYMKTTIEISDELAARAKAFAARERLTLRAVVEQGIRLVLREAKSPAEFRLRDDSLALRLWWLLGSESLSSSTIPARESVPRRLHQDMPTTSS